MHPTTPGPIFDAGHQAFADRVFHGVGPFLGELFRRADAVMESTALPCPRFARVLPGEAVFPKSDPAFDGEARVTRRAEKVKMVGHEQVIAHQPSCSLGEPKSVEGIEHRLLRDPRVAIFRADGQPENIWPGEGKVRALSRSLAPDVRVKG